MSTPPNKTRTQPGLGEGGADAVPRLNSAEIKRVRREAREEEPTSVDKTPPPIGMAERPRLRDSVRREDPDDAAPAATRPADEVIRPRIRDSVRRDDPDDAPPVRPAEEVFRPRPSTSAREGLPRETPKIAANIVRPGGAVEEVFRPRVRDSVRREDPNEPAEAAKPPDSARPRIRDSVRRDDPDELTPDAPPTTPRSEQVSLRPVAPPRRGSALWQPEKETGTRPKPASGRSQRPPVTVDEVGATALKIARTTRREGSPKLVASRAIVSKAPIDTRSAFVLSLVDGRNTVDAIVDMAGMPGEEVKAILERLARLGLIQLP